MKIINRILAFFAKENNLSKELDKVYLSLYGLELKLIRSSKDSVPHEVSIIVPRAEIREIYNKKGNKILGREIILNSITVVHAPRHPLAGEQQQTPQLPKKGDII
ncbi:MAG: hypothetical protein M0Z31_13865 [Clostridia bacterium]|nr:hypothetical protein [Clostridia bacterium]